MRTHTLTAIMAFGMFMFICGSIINWSEGASWIVFVIASIVFVISFVGGIIESFN